MTSDRKEQLFLSKRFFSKIKQLFDTPTTCYHYLGTMSEKPPATLYEHQRLLFTKEKSDKNNEVQSDNQSNDANLDSSEGINSIGISIKDLGSLEDFEPVRLRASQHRRGSVTNRKAKRKNSYSSTDRLNSTNAFLIHWHRSKHAYVFIL